MYLNYLTGHVATTSVAHYFQCATASVIVRELLQRNRAIYRSLMQMRGLAQSTASTG